MKRMEKRTEGQAMTDKTREVLDGIKTRLAAAGAHDGATWSSLPALTDDNIIMHRVYDDEGLPVAECSSPDVAALAAAAPADVARLTRAVEDALGWAEKFETNQSSDIAKRQEAQFDLGYSAGRRAAGNILRVVIENALNP